MPGYSLGPATYVSPHARVETKPSGWTGGRRDSGGGYERIRSWEHDPTAAGDGKRDVYAYVHRLCAVAWCYDGEPVDAILADLAGRDIHHESGVEWLNCHDSPNLPQDEFGLAVMDHGRHSEITQAQVRAWAEDASRALEDDEPEPDACDACGAVEAVLVRGEGFDGLRCIGCAQDVQDAGTLEVV